MWIEDAAAIKATVNATPAMVVVEAVEPRMGLVLDSTGWHWLGYSVEAFH
jgi:hypothetical protein